MEKHQRVKHTICHLLQRIFVCFREALYNTFHAISKDDWNHSLGKSQVFISSWVAQKIRTQYKGYFDDQVTGQRQEWKKGEILSLAELITLKLYTDFDKLQFELKKCFRYQTVSDILKNDAEDEDDKKMEATQKAAKSDLKERLRHFYHWRGSLLIVLHKFGTKWSTMNNMALYHGVNTKMLIRASQTFAFNGPLSTSSSYHVARTFATAKGMVLKVTSHFPRLNYCNAFDASSISDYPEEQEWLIGFMYLRLLEVRTRKLSDNAQNFTELMKIVPISSWMRKEFFAIHLFGEQIYSMSDHLERIIAQFLRANRFECCNENQEKKYEHQRIQCKDWDKDECKLVNFLCEHKMHSEEVIEKNRAKWIDNKLIHTCERVDNVSEDDWNRKMKILPVLTQKFNEFRLNSKSNKRQRVKFDVISSHLKRFFMEQSKKENDILTGKRRWDISFEQISTVYPTAKELHFVNNFSLNDVVLRGLIDHINDGNKILKQMGEKEDWWQNSIEKVVFLYYDYTDKQVDQNGKPTGHKKFVDPDKLDKNLKKELNALKPRWIIKANKIQKSGYKIRILKTKKK